MRKNRKNDSHTRRKRICIAALLLAGSLIPGGCGIKKEKTSDSELPEIVIGKIILNLTAIRRVMASIKVLMWNLQRKPFRGWVISLNLRRLSGKIKRNFCQMEQ